MIILAELLRGAKLYCTNHKTLSPVVAVTDVNENARTAIVELVCGCLRSTAAPISGDANTAPIAN